MPPLLIHQRIVSSLLVCVGVQLVPSYSAFATPSATGDEALKNQVLKEAPKEWSRFRERAKNRASTIILKTILAGATTIEGTVSSQSRGHSKLHIEETAPSKMVPSQVTVHGINEQYYFQLLAEKREGPFKLVTLQRRTREDVGQTMPENMLKPSWRNENDFIFLQVEALPEIFSKTYFQLHSAEYLTEGKNRFIRCKITYDHQKRDLTIPYGKVWLPYKEFTLDLDPDNYYQIRRVTYELSNQTDTYVFTDEITPGSAPGDPPYVYESRVIDKPTGNLVRTDRHEYVERSFTAPPKANFYLTAFGLPEPPGFQKKGIPVFVWFVGAGLIAIVAAIFWQRSKKAVR